jgi:hypothetical protein
MSEAPDAMEAEPTPNCPCPPGPAPNLHWVPGKEVPPLVASNRLAVALCARILSGTNEEWPLILVSEAVAIQVYRLVLDAKLRAVAFKSATWADLYTIQCAWMFRRSTSLAGDLIDDTPLQIGCNALLYQ